ncbi:MAG TPA: DUF3299 domain-containing protein, partial [Denitromonas sp.]|nr:DUF3299 domain-containing protein [Denitromonas sp.]
GSGYKVGDRLARPAVPAPPASDDYREISWDDLMPADWDPMALLDKLDKLDMNSMEDADPRAMEALAAIRKAWDEAPVVPALMSQRIRIPGFLVRLEGDQEGITEFLLVPYFGACVHVPPPPSNQVIHVVAAKPVPADQNMQAVWVSGVMSVAAAATDMGNAGYRIEAQKVAPYAEELPAR